MGKFITSFEDHNTYQQVIFDENNTPNVSLCKDNYEIHYTPLIVPLPMVDGHEYVEIGGLKWATMNIGANSVTDTGLYFAWGDTQGYTAAQVGEGEGQKYFGWDDYKYTNDGGSTMTKYNSTDSLVTLQSGDDAVTTAWGGDWRMPTTAEFQALGDATTSAWTSITVDNVTVNGMMLTDKTDSTKTLFFPAAGYCYNGSFYRGGSYGYYWSGSLYTSNVYGAYRMYFLNGYVYWQNNNYRCNGYSVRGVVG